MKTLNQQELKTFEQFFQLTQPQLLKAMRQYLKSVYPKGKVVSTKDYVMAIGTIPVALVAHLDTVFKSPPSEIYYDRVKNIMLSPSGLGADDRAGVYAIIQLVRAGFRPTVIFTTDEEMGGLGAECFIKTFRKAPTELKYIIELDRRGSDDCVFYSCDNEEFSNYIESFGFITNYGSFSDISVICPAWKIAGVNLSIGYNNEHSTGETLHVGKMYNTIAKVKKMLQVADEAKSYEYIEGFAYERWFRRYKQSDSIYDFDKAYPYGGSSSYYEDEYTYGLTDEQIASYTGTYQVKCHFCGTYEYEFNTLPVKHPDGSTIFVCPDCLVKKSNICFCSLCGEAFINEDPRESSVVYCKDCKGAMSDACKSAEN